MQPPQIVRQTTVAIRSIIVFFISLSGRLSLDPVFCALIPGISRRCHNLDIATGSTDLYPSLFYPPVNCFWIAAITPGCFRYGHCVQDCPCHFPSLAFLTDGERFIHFDPPCISRKTSFIAFFTVCIIHIVLFAFSGYNTWIAIENAIQNNSHQMGYYSFDLVRYLLVSAGNLLAYLAILGFPIIGLVAFGFIDASIQLPFKIKTLGVSLIITLIAFSFSNQFYLEIERIWIFISPFYIILAGSVLSRLKENTPKFQTILFVLMSTTITFLLGVTINHCV